MVHSLSIMFIWSKELLYILILMLFLFVSNVMCSLQHMWHSAPGASREESHPLQLLLLLHRHLLHCGLRGRHSSHMALPAAGGHYDLRGPGGAAPAGTPALLLSNPHSVRHAQPR